MDSWAETKSDAMPTIDDPTKLPAELMADDMRTMPELMACSDSVASFMQQQPISCRLEGSTRWRFSSHIGQLFAGARGRFVDSRLDVGYACGGGRE
jgi:hypothetical protein